MGISDQAQPRGTLKILWEGLKLAYNNLALLYPILLLSFLSSSLFFLLGYLCAPLALDLATKSILVGNTDPESPEYSILTVVLKELKERGPIEVVVLVISFIANSLVATATVHVLSTAYSSNTPSSKLIKEVVFARLNWSLIRRSMITQLHVASFKVMLTVSVLSFYYSSSSFSLSLSLSHTQLHVAAATVHVLSTAYSSKTPSSKLKEVVFAGLNWSLIKRCMITQLYGAFVYVGCSLVVGLTVVVLSFSFTYYSYSSSSGSYVGLMVTVALGVIVAVLDLCLFLYLSMVLNTGVVVSVVEEGSCYGLEAIAKASKLFRGRRKQAILIALVELVVGGVLYAGYNLVMAHAPSISTVQLALGFGQVALGVVINVLTWSVLTVYYYECSAGYVEGIAMEGAGFKYNPVPTQVGEALL